MHIGFAGTLVDGQQLRGTGSRHCRPLRQRRGRHHRAAARQPAGAELRHCSHAKLTVVQKSKFERALAAVTVLAAVTLSAAAPASYAACVAMAIRPASLDCQTQSEYARSSSMQMRMDCLAQLHGLDACVASQPAVLTSPLFHFVALTPPPPVLTAPVFVPRLRLTKPPPLRSPVPLTIRYSVFLK